ncbi:hypothetical protein C8R43DRAFT_1122697 [Mycena crocata]|nr:hypothetical protein C8R43DRAFT_1122697 [Mycena crocata]
MASRLGWAAPSASLGAQQVRHTWQVRHDSLATIHARLPICPPRRAKNYKPGLEPRPPPFKFKGARLVFLKNYTDYFAQAKAGNALPQFWDDICSAYWVEFPWRLPIDEEPHDGVPIDDPLVELSAAESSERRYTMTKTRIEIKTFFYRQSLAR